MGLPHRSLITGAALALAAILARASGAPPVLRVQGPTAPPVEPVASETSAPALPPSVLDLLPEDSVSKLKDPEVNLEVAPNLSILGEIVPDGGPHDAALPVPVVEPANLGLEHAGGGGTILPFETAGCLGGAIRSPSVAVDSFSSTETRASTSQARIEKAYGKLPLSFEANEGQTDPRVRFLSRGRGFNLFVTSREIVLALRRAAPSQPAGVGLERHGVPGFTQTTIVRMKLKGTESAPALKGLDERKGKSHYFLGKDPSKWHVGIPHYGKVEYEGLYRGVDLVLYGNEGQLEYDFVLAPGADPRAVQFAFEGVKALRVDAEGDLVLATKAGEMRQRKPLVYQEHEGTRRRVEGRYVVKGKHRVGFEVAEYDVTRPLVIDPVLAYASFLGGGDYEFGNSIAVDGDGNAYVTGQTQSTDFPTTPGVFQGSNSSIAGRNDVFVTKVNAKGDALVYSTYLGGPLNDSGTAIAVDTSGSAFVAGNHSSGFPLVNAAQSFGNAFVVKLDGDGSALVFSTYWGAPTSDAAGLAVDAEGNAYVTGAAVPPWSHTTPGAFQPNPAGGTDGYVSKFSPSGSLIYSTWLGGNLADFPSGVAVDSLGNACVTGHTRSSTFPTQNPIQGNNRGTTNGHDNAFVSKLNPAGSGLVYSTYLGGSTGDDSGKAIATDALGNAYVTGSAASADFPTTQTAGPGGGQDAFVVKIDPIGALAYSTRLGGSGWDVGFGIAARGGPGIYVAGTTTSTNFPAVGAFQGTLGGGLDAFVTRLNPSGAVDYSSYLGGEADEYGGGGFVYGNGIATDSSGNAYVTGTTWSDQFPVTPSAFQLQKNSGSAACIPYCYYIPDAFVAKIGASGPTIDILLITSTTRWKPQRDTTAPITVNFKGPNDLDPATVRLEVTPPAGFFGTYTPTLAAVTKISGTDDQYIFDWTGPWTYTDASGNSQLMPRGNYSLVVFGRRANSTTEIKNETPFDKVSLVEVTTIRLEATNGAALETNPGPGGGLRIFAEASQPGGNDVFDKVKVIATIDPPIPDAPVDKRVRVVFRSFDVDDPSASTTPVDDELQPTDNCLEARLGPPLNCPIADDGFLYDTIADPGAASPVNGRTGLSLKAAGDLVVAGLRVAMLHGANYRVAASTSNEWLGGLDTIQGTGAGELRHASGESLLDPGTGQFRHPQVSEMLTVWRTLHLELDRMDPVGDGVTQERLQYNGSWTRIGRTWRSFPPFAAGRVLEDQNATFVTPTLPGQEVDHTKPNDWVGATVDPFAFGGRECVDSEVPPCYRVALNSNIKLTIASGNLNDEANPNDRRYYLRDDELKSLTERQHDTSLLKDILRDVYIEVAEDSPNPNPLIPFTQNLPSKELELIKGDTPSSPAYWSVPVLLAFESALNRDYDPTDERAYPTDNVERGPVAGETSHGDQPVSAIFVESIRDFLQTGTGCKKPTISLTEYYRSNTAHEVLHALTLDDEGTEQGGLMCASVKNYVNQPGRNQITNSQKLQLRKTTRPFVDDENSGTCPSLKCQ